MELSGAWNFRDVAEQTGIRPGLLYRSSELSRLDDSGRATCPRSASPISSICARTVRWSAAAGGLLPAGVAVHLLPFHFDDDSEQDAPHESTFQRVMSESPADEDVAESAKRYMAEVYEEFPPALPGAQTAVRQVIAMLADHKPVLAHCFAGKDRTGFTVATVLEAVGIDRAAILTDFLRSNDAIAPPLREQILESVRARSDSSEVITFAEARLTDEVLGGARGVPGRGVAGARREVRLTRRFPGRRGSDSRPTRPTARRPASVISAR